MKALFYFLIFPGFLFTTVIGLLASWIDRKITARVQWRVGPPWYQPFADIIKLLGKETIVPRQASFSTFIFAPLAGLACVTLVSTFVWMTDIWPDKSFIGDFIVVLYLLTIPSICLIMGGFASGNPIASLGASREMKLILSYELPFALAMMVPTIKSGGMIRLGELIKYQSAYGAFAMSLSGIVALVAVIISMQAKLSLAPFDIPEAETEIMGGLLIEYSGTPLAIFKLTKAALLFTRPVFVVFMFMGGIGAGFSSVILGVLKYILLLVLVILIRNTNPRLRVDQAIKFFWGPVTGLAILAVVLAFFGI